MDHFYFVRHGQTNANLQGLMCGASWDECLNETGIDQARFAALTLRKAAPDIRTVCTSPLIRARKTAEIIAEKLCAPVTTIDELAEWDIGHWDRSPFESVREQFLGSGEPIGGETRAQFKGRVSLVLAKITELACPVLLVSHGALWLALQEILGATPTTVDNGVPHRVSFDGNAWRAVCVAGEISEST